MKIVTKEISLKTSGQGDLVNITDDLRILLKESRLREGSLLVFAAGSMFSVAACEYELGLMKDMGDLYERLAPAGAVYSSGDNGFGHLRSALQGQSLTIPFRDAKLMLGARQQVVVAEFDAARDRQVVAQFTGEL